MLTLAAVPSSLTQAYASFTNLFGDQPQAADKQAPARSNNEIRESYNVQISAAYENGFKEKFASYHANQQCFGEHVAREAYEARNTIKEQHQEETSSIGQAVIAMRNLFKYGTLGNVGYDQLVKSGKNPEEIAYSAFKTGGKDLGLANNGFGDTLEVWQAIKSHAPHMYPEHITPNMVAAYKAQAANNELDVEAILMAGDPGQCSMHEETKQFFSMPKTVDVHV